MTKPEFERLLGTIYLLDLDSKAKILEAIKQGINDGFDENPPHGKWVDLLESLDNTIKLAKQLQ